MTKEQQDLAWACLPKEVRKEIKMLWELDTMPVHPFLDPDSVAEGAAYVLTDIFGYHNLTSDTEPEEMLMVERVKILHKYSVINKAINDTVSTDTLYFLKGKLSILKFLLGDKCLPDKEEPKPKFKVGDKVKIILCTHPEYRNKVGIITSIDSCGNPYVKVDGLGTLFHAPYALEPYTEEPRNLSQETANCDKSEDNQLKDNLEEKELGKEDNFLTKELDIYELLQDCSDVKTIY
ncbi:MAG: hypothetical protein K2M39_00880, partial [Muribaculaceae bacterium]|nr:hypothetical protein [Muribaculaceae bacterium]